MRAKLTKVNLFIGLFSLVVCLVLAELAINLLIPAIDSLKVPKPDIIKKASIRLSLKAIGEEHDPYFLDLYLDNQVGWNCFDESLQRISSDAAKRNIRTIIILLPNDSAWGHYKGFYKEIGEHVRRSNLEYVSLEDVFSDAEFQKALSSFGHYNAYGNEQVASKLYSYLST